MYKIIVCMCSLDQTCGSRKNCIHKTPLPPSSFPSPDTLQLLFQVHGQLSSAMVSLVVRKHTLWRSGLLYESLMVDLPNGERLVLKGSPLANVLERYTARLT